MLMMLSTLRGYGVDMRESSQPLNKYKLQRHLISQPRASHPSICDDSDRKERLRTYQLRSRKTQSTARSHLQCSVYLEKIQTVQEPF